jgi:NAD(P)-dependent dehydrogenase (short-subunit alcohol dehydrogenase family)
MRVAVVTGASRGIGRAIAIQLAADGFSIVLTGRDEAALDDVARQIGENNAWIALDLRMADSAQRLVDFAVEKFGRIDVLVNNAGATKRGPFLALSDGDWSDGFALKFFGAVRLTRAAWPQLKSTGGSVVHMSGIGGRTPGPEFAIGGSVNAALLSFTKVLADLGIADGVQVNAINPGAVRTDRFHGRLQRIMRSTGLDAAAAERRFIEESGIVRVGEPEDVARLVSYLVSAAGRFLHGSLIDIDGGQTKTL